MSHKYRTTIDRNIYFFLQKYRNTIYRFSEIQIKKPRNTNKRITRIMGELLNYDKLLNDGWFFLFLFFFLRQFESLVNFGVKSELLKYGWNLKSWVNMKMCQYELWMNMNHGWILYVCEYESWVNVNYGWIRIMGKDEFWLKLNYGCILFMCSRVQCDACHKWRFRRWNRVSQIKKWLSKFLLKK